MVRFRSLTSLLLALALGPAALGQHYIQTNLVSDDPSIPAAHTDTVLKNAWGMSRTATSPWWVSDNGTGKATLYNGAGVKNTAVQVTIATPPGDLDPATPTGQVANGTTGFTVSKTVNGITKSGPARFIFATEDGTISGWNPTVDAANSIIGVDNSASAIYKGLAILTVGSTTRLYAANFKGGTIDVFGSDWSPVTSVTLADPSLPAGYAPFNIQALGTSLFVAYAKVGDLPDEQHGKGLGFVDEFDANGTLLRRFQHGPWLNAPWGMAIAPATGFGQFSGNLIVGNFGSGRIVAYDRNTGEFLGFLHGARGPLVIDGLWGLAFGNAGSNGLPTELFFTAGPDDESHGLFGKLVAAPDQD